MPNHRVSVSKGPILVIVKNTDAPGFGLWWVYPAAKTAERASPLSFVTARAAFLHAFRTDMGIAVQNQPRLRG